eukprot:scaffold213285_cov50-Attheya_sp.AAC.1
MGYLFNKASAFNQDVSSWNVSSIINMGWMFNTVSAFNQDISSWEVSSVITTGWMFNNASAFNQDLCDWGVNTPSLSVVKNMFVVTSCPSLATPEPVSQCDTTAKYHQGPFCHGCTPQNDSNGFSILK